MRDSRKEIIPNAATGFAVAAETSGLPELACGWAVRDYSFGDVVLKLTLPGQPDSLLDEKSVRAANHHDDYMPYWAYLWPAAIAMSQQIINGPWAKGTEVLELGCGVGLVGLAALAVGCRVTMTDYDPQAVVVAAHNARLNGFTDFDVQQLDWRNPPARQFPVILGCDLLYEERNLEPILNLLDRMLSPGGECWLADGGRRHIQLFLRLAGERGFEIRIFNAEGIELSVPNDQLQVFRMQKLL